MIIPGVTLVRRQLVRNLLSASSQTQPCGVDLSLRQVNAWKNAGVIDFDNSGRKASKLVPLDFSANSSVLLEPGAYHVDFNEEVDIPLDAAGQLFVRSSLWRSGATLTAGLVDSGYRGPMSALLHVHNAHGIELCQNAKLGQIVMHMLTEEVVGYDGIYQGRRKQAAADASPVSVD